MRQNVLWHIEKEIFVEIKKTIQEAGFFPFDVNFFFWKKMLISDNITDHVWNKKLLKMSWRRNFSILLWAFLCLGHQLDRKLRESFEHLLRAELT